MNWSGTRKLTPSIILACVAAVALLNDVFAVRAAEAGERAAWTSSRIIGSPDPPAPYRVERRFPALQFKNPLELVPEPGSDRWWIVELEGKFWTFKNDNQTAKRELALDLKQVCGPKARAYGLAFHPNFEINRQIYVCYIVDPKKENGTIVSEFRVDKSDRPVVDPKSERVLIRWLSGGHNGGSLKFGPDGFLYISTGDAEVPSPPDPLNTGQDISDLMSSILRIDVDRADGRRNYAIPSENPFQEHEGARPEIWAFGFRNPWRMSFDRETGDLWVGDVGWELWEMIFRVERGGNYGWSIMEGSRQSVKPNNPRGPAPITPPIAEHPHTEAMSITGGFVYRGDRLKDLKGAYLYGDYVTGKMWALRARRGVPNVLDEIATSSLRIICYGEGHDGEVYAVDYAGGIYWLVPNEDSNVKSDFPRKLSETGLFSATPEQTPAPGVLPYEINVAPWEDHATGERFVGIPNRGKLGVHKINNLGFGIVRGAWSFPSNSVLAKTISMEMERGNSASRRRLETQILHFDGKNWNPYSYIWNDEQTDAELAGSEGGNRELEIVDATAPGGKHRHSWHFPSRAECMLCHTTRGGVIYGFTAQQLDRPGDGNADQLAAFFKLGLFEHPIKRKKIKPMPPPHDESADIEQRARAYLHVNCSHCHMRGGGGTAVFDVRYHISKGKSLLIGTPASQGTFGIADAKIVAPGKPFNSTLPYRMAKLGSGRMPHFGSSVVDDQGLRLMFDWIEKMPAPAGSSGLKWDPVKFDRMLNALRDGSPRAVAAAIDRHLSDSANALRVIRALQEKSFDPALRRLLIARGAAHPKLEIRDLFERFLPKEQRTQRLGLSFAPKQVLDLTGDATRGKAVFLRESVQCVNCHRLEGRGRELGPDLREIGGKYSREQLLEHLTQPSKFIDPKYVAYNVETSDDESYAGFLVERTDEIVVLKTLNGEVVKLSRRDIGPLRSSAISTMPAGILQALTANEAADLLAFLESLK
jgi:putative heme-binding domain-containing protein